MRLADYIQTLFLKENDKYLKNIKLQNVYRTLTIEREDLKQQKLGENKNV